METSRFFFKKTAPGRLTRTGVRERIRDYGFTEVADVLTFLNTVCRAELGLNEIVYIRRIIGSCLGRNDDKSDYFIPLREFVTELDCLIEINAGAE
ncbi:hypothetical protein IFU37_023305 (plasmid) [Pantoea agglomerans]|uniref:hypothetical protein n=1 Tax=Enterobacter agglomerans TaxID=549 RepID=UPI00177D920C|nr:hypothetical protein [Pantoea agglomerans]WVL92371.1 hypothetical protein IFU37_023305 [Pantoea agglomerans]